MNSKLSFVHVCLRCFLLPAVMGLICYQCKSSSWDRCRTTTKTCHPDHNRCGKIYYKNDDGKTFLKNCVSETDCVNETSYYCKRADECDVHCCLGNDCNAGALYIVSGVLFLTCAVISVVAAIKT